MSFIFESLFFIFSDEAKNPIFKRSKYENLWVESFAGLAPLVLLEISTFYRPDNSNYPTVDFILVECKKEAKKKYKIIFIQVTIKNPETKFKTLNEVMESSNSVLSRMFCAWFELLKNSEINLKEVEFDFWLMHDEDKSVESLEAPAKSLEAPAKSLEAPAKCFSFPNQLRDFIVKAIV